MKKSNIVLLALVLLAISACKKDPKEVIPEEKTIIELLTGNGSKTWQVKEGIALFGGAEVDLIASQNPCVTDNRFELFNDFSYEFTEGASKCDPNDPDLILKANWELSADKSTLTIDKFIFLGRTIDKPVFVLSDTKESSFSGTTSLEFNGAFYEMTVTFEEVI